MPMRSKTFLRRAERDDLDTVIAWMEDPEFLHFLYGDPARSPRQIRAHIVGMLGRASGQAMPGGVYLIIDSTDKGPLGLLSLQNVSWRNRSCTIDLFMGKEEYRSGHIAGLAIFRALEYCFDELNLHRVGAYVYAFNTASWRIFERTGAQREMTLREHVMRDGKMHDLYAYGLLRPEFEALRERVYRMGGASLQEMVKFLADQEAVEAS
jgi:RimJ/RimL family protein N-acetyltransferase